jgi:hypothetical protein
MLVKASQPIRVVLAASCVFAKVFNCFCQRVSNTGKTSGATKIAAFALQTSLRMGLCATFSDEALLCGLRG